MESSTVLLYWLAIIEVGMVCRLENMICRYIATNDIDSNVNLENTICCLAFIIGQIQ